MSKLTLRILAKRVERLMKKDPEVVFVVAIQTVVLAIHGPVQLQQEVMTFMINEGHTPKPRPSRSKCLSQ